MTPGQAFLAAVQHHQQELRREHRHADAHRMVTAQASISEEDAERILSIMMAGYQERRANPPAALVIGFHAQPAALAHHNGG